MTAAAASEGFLDTGEGLDEDGLNGGKGQVAPVVSGHDYEVAGDGEGVAIAAEGFAEEAFDAVSADGVAAAAPDEHAEAGVAEVVGQCAEGDFAEPEGGAGAEDGVELGFFDESVCGPEGAGGAGIVLFVGGAHWRFSRGYPGFCGLVV